MDGRTMSLNDYGTGISHIHTPRGAGHTRAHMAVVWLCACCACASAPCVRVSLVLVAPSCLSVRTSWVNIDAIA